MATEISMWVAMGQMMSLLGKLLLSFSFSFFFFNQQISYVASSSMELCVGINSKMETGKASQNLGRGLLLCSEIKTSDSS